MLSRIISFVAGNFLYNPVKIDYFLINKNQQIKQYIPAGRTCGITQLTLLFIIFSLLIFSITFYFIMIYSILHILLKKNQQQSFIHPFIYTYIYSYMRVFEISKNFFHSYCLQKTYSNVCPSFSQVVQTLHFCPPLGLFAICFQFVIF